MDVDILLWGGTHRFEAFEMEGRFFVNPGSATGALSTGYWPEGEEPTPSFCLMDVSRDSFYILTILFFLFLKLVLIQRRSKATFSCYMSTSSRRMPKGPRPLLSRRCHSVKMLSLRHELCLSLFNFCVYPRRFPPCYDWFPASSFHYC